MKTVILVILFSLVTSSMVFAERAEYEVEIKSLLREGYKIVAGGGPSARGTVGFIILQKGTKASFYKEILFYTGTDRRDYLSPVSCHRLHEENN